ncbi:uncharacterized protein LOC131023904 isoform X2 [Salvia miltiorrhiza]|uniref:uncharacterized protein LOC131023904 isoform X2 n=1 Tax=Salvia miltiorrhiza TaxID=226208 RepID=UPI0025ACFEC7|nr:uncharacterized protein LOC131023904 isoform X2 [Salvia miltiorrhiza]
MTAAPFALMISTFHPELAVATGFALECKPLYWLKEYVMVVSLSHHWLSYALGCDLTASCILELWRYRAKSKQCKCPICGCLIHNLVLQSSIVIEPGEEVGKILRDIQLYNTMNLGGLSGLLMKAAALPVVIRRGVWENLNITMLEYICNSMHRIGLLLGVMYEVFELQFFPSGGLGIAVWFDMCIYGLVVFLLWDVIWQRWMIIITRLL